MKHQAGWLSQVHIVGWEYSTGGGFSWYPFKKDADAECKRQQGYCKDKALAKDGWCYYRLTFKPKPVKGTEEEIHDSITTQCQDHIDKLGDSKLVWHGNRERLIELIEREQNRKPRPSLLKSAKHVFSAEDAVKLRKANWLKDNHHLRAFQQGWDLFDCGDGFLRILALDDPIGVAADFDLNPITPLANDDEALAKVLEGAANGNQTCLLALLRNNTPVKLYREKKRK